MQQDFENVKLNYDGYFTIATGASAGSKKWKNSKTSWKKFLGRIATPVVTGETYKDFMSASKADQGQIKDVGGFVGATLQGGKRSKNSVLSRQLVTLDVDFSHNDFWWDFTMLFSCAACIHSTHKHCKAKPRHRLIIPLDREVSQEEYQAIARKIAGDMNIELFDQSTFDVNRLMFWPSISCDSEYFFEYQDAEFLSADYILGLYDDWTDINEWPRPTDYTDKIMSAIRKQENPCEKKGIIGLFCRTYTIQDCMDTFLKDEYVEASEGRYTYSKGSTAAGVLIYEDKFCYSHHGTDPAGGRLCNAFDLVRIHKFGHLDSGTEKFESDKKSFKAMEEFAAKDPGVKMQIAEEKFANAKVEFAEQLENCDEDAFDTEWTKQLSANTKGEYENTANNINLIIKNDSMLKNAFKLNIFDNKRYVVKTLPWRKVKTIEPLRDVDYAGVRNYIECVYGIVASQKVDDALALEFEKHSFHPIVDYLKSLKWDGIERIDTLLIDYFGATDSIYTRAAIRKMLCAAVTRVMNPGVKFDLAMILSGEQGVYKSTFLNKLGKDWFSDTFTTVQGKEAFEQIQGAWIVEIAELSGLKKAEVETIKHYISKREDSFRPAYGRVVETYKRQCVFFGTTNSKDFLRDPTGNRRFLPIDVNKKFITKSVKDDLDEAEIDQIWAEAYQLYLNGETLYMSENEEAIAKKEQSKHAEVDERKGIIERYLNLKVPADWDKMDLSERRVWLDEPIKKKGTKLRDIICIAEIASECLGNDICGLDRFNSRGIAEIMKTIDGWEAQTDMIEFPLYGKQKYYTRIYEDDLM